MVTGLVVVVVVTVGLKVVTDCLGEETNVDFFVPSVVNGFSVVPNELNDPYCSNMGALFADGATV